MNLFEKKKKKKMRKKSGGTASLYSVPVLFITNLYFYLDYVFCCDCDDGALEGGFNFVHVLSWRFIWILNLTNLTRYLDFERLSAVVTTG